MPFQAVFTRSLHRCLRRRQAPGWLPKSWGQENKNGPPIVLLGFFVVVGLIPVITGMNTTDISNIGTGCSKLSGLLMVYACFRLPDVLPEVYERSTLFTQGERTVRFLLDSPPPPFSQNHFQEGEH